MPLRSLRHSLPYFMLIHELWWLPMSLWNYQILALKVQYQRTMCFVLAQSTLPVHLKGSFQAPYGKTRLCHSIKQLRSCNPSVISIWEKQPFRNNTDTLLFIHQFILNKHRHPIAVFQPQIVLYSREVCQALQKQQELVIPRRDYATNSVHKYTTEPASEVLKVLLENIFQDNLKRYMLRKEPMEIRGSCLNMCATVD